MPPLPEYRFDRREFLRLSALGLGAAGLSGIAGCVSDPTTLPRLALAPSPANAGNTVLSHSVHIPIREGQEPALLALLDRPDAKVFPVATPGVHFARAAVLGARHVARPQLTLGVIYDNRLETALNFLTTNAAAQRERGVLDETLQHCEGYVAGTARDPVTLRSYLAPYLVADNLFFTAYNKAENEVQACLAVQDGFLTLLRAAAGVADAQLPYLVDRFLLTGVANVRMDDAPRPIVQRDHLPFRPHLTNTLTMVQPLLQGRLDPGRVVPCSKSRLETMERFVGKHFTYRQAFDFILTEGEFAVKGLREHPLAALHTLHFARIAVIDGDRMLFSSVYDGDFTQYVLDFGSRVADQIDFIWGLTESYPRAGCRDVKAFIDWIRRGQVDVEDFFSAHGNVTLLRIQKASKLREQVALFSRQLPPDGARLRALLNEFARANQALLG